MLATKLQVAISKIMAKYEISKSAAVLLAVTQGCHIEQALSPADYEIFNGRYKRKLVDIVKAGRENSHIPKAELERQRREQCTASFQQIRENEKIEGVRVTLKGMFEQWDSHDLTWKIKTITFAKKYSDEEYAKLIIAKEKDCDIISQASAEKESAI